MSSAEMSDWASQLRAYKSGQAVAPSSSRQHHQAKGSGSNAEHRSDASTKTKITPSKVPSISHQSPDLKREKIPLLGNKSLERCVQLLNQMMLETDGGEVKTHSNVRASLAKAKVSKSYKPKMTLKKKNPKAKCKSHNKKTKVTHDVPRGAVKPVLKSASIQSAADSTKFDVPERDSNPKIECLPLHHYSAGRYLDSCSQPAFQMQSASVPFNKRLSTSTPTQPLDSGVSPWKYIPGSSQSICSEEYHLTRAGNNPLNATDQCKEVAPPPVPQPEPKLTEAAFALTDNPQAPTPVVSALEGHTLNEGYSLYSASTPLTMISSPKDQYSDPMPLCSWKENTTVVETSARSQPALVSSSSQTKNTSSHAPPIQPLVLPASITQPLYSRRRTDDSKKDTETQTSVHEGKETPPPPKLRALSDLLKELKSAVSCGNHAAFPRLVADLEATSNSMVWGKKVNQQLELDLAIQPLRTENAQLRRQLRLANLLKKGNKDEVKSEDSAQQNINAVHFEMMRHQLEATLREERAAMERLRERSCQLQSELQIISDEKQQLLSMVMKKDQDYVQELDKILSERKKLCSEVEQLRKQVKELESQIQQQQQLAQVELKGRDDEILKLQDLVGNLQKSMRRLLTDLQTKPDTSCREIAESTQSTLDSILNGSNAKEMIDEQFNGIQINLHKSSPRSTESHKSAKKSLFPKETDIVSFDTSKNLASISDNMGVNMTMSDYDMPPGASPFGSKFRVNEGLTVKELLTPLANRMQHQFNRMHTVKPDDIAGYSSIESDPAESESTLVEEEEAVEKEESVSRYSITDYFTKYSAKEKPASMERLSERESSSDSSPSPLKGSLRPSVQSSLYKGTDLDTSLSTIPGAEDGRSVVSSEVSTDTVSTVDDHAFKRGLAALDANISRMQQQLRVTSQ